MSITMEAFDNLGFEIVKQKYYNANKVNAKLDELKAGISELIAENEALKSSVKENEELSAAADALVASSQQIADAKIADAEAQAEKIIADAKQAAERILADAKQTDSVVPEGGFTAAQLDIIDELNRQLDSLSTIQSTQIFKIKQQLMRIVIG